MQKALRNYMAEQGLKTGEQLAERAEVSHQAVFTWLNDEHIPPKRAAERIGRRLNWPEFPAICDRARRARGKRKAVA